MGIGETLRRAFAKLVMRAAGDQAKTACGNLELYSGLDTGIEGATHAVGQRILARLQERREEAMKAEEAEEEEEQSERIEARLTNLNIETAATKEEAVEGLAAALNMEVEEDRGSDGEEEGGGTQRSLESLEFLTQEAEPSSTTLGDARNGFNELSLLEMMWTL